MMINYNLYVVIEKAKIWADWIIISKVNQASEEIKTKIIADLMDLGKEQLAVKQIIMILFYKAIIIILEWLTAMKFMEKIIKMK
jgi:hypothetical protein